MGFTCAKTKKEVKELVEIHASSKENHKLFIVLVGSISDQATAVCKAAGVQPEWAHILAEKDKQDDKGEWRKINDIREGYIWKVNDLSEKLAHKTAVPKAAGQEKDQVNLQMQISEFHDKKI